MKRSSVKMKTVATSGNASSARPAKSKVPAKGALQERAKRLENWVDTLTKLRTVHRELRERNAGLSEAMQKIDMERRRYETLFRMAPDGYVVTNETDVIMDANHVAEALLGSPSPSPSPSPLIGLTLSDFIANEDYERLHALYLQMAARPGAVLEVEILMKPHEQASFPAFLRVMGSRNWRTGEISFQWLFKDVSERKRYEEALAQREANLRESQAELRTLATRLMTAQDEERQRISRDLHDDINQRLALLAMDLETLEQECPASSNGFQETLGEIRGRITELSGDLRGLAYGLHNTVLEDLGLPMALQRYAGDYTKRTGIKCMVALMDVPKILPKGVGSALFKVAQECLGNVLKHAKAKEVLITVAGTDNSIRLSVRDNGVGFEADSHEVRTKGMGFVSMRERILMLGGEFLMQSEPGHGSVVIVRVPLSYE